MSKNKKTVTNEMESPFEPRVRHIVNQMNYVPGREKFDYDPVSATVPGMCKTIQSLMLDLSRGRTPDVYFQPVFEEHLNLPEEYAAVRHMDKVEAHWAGKQIRKVISDFEADKAELERRVASQKQQSIDKELAELREFKKNHAKLSPDS
jgi:hypothetical protein